MAVVPDDSVLVEGTLTGDISCFGALVERHASAVRAVALSCVRSPDDASDVCQETFLRAQCGLAQLKDAGHFRSWVLAIARHVALDLVRARARWTDDVEAAGRIISASPSPEDWTLAADLTASVRRQLLAMTERDATLIAMVVDLGFGPSEVAEALGLTAGSAKVAVHRARRRLRHQMEASLIA